MKNIQFAFECLVKNTSETNHEENLKSVALSIWYERFTPNINEMKGKHAAQAGFILDRLTRYNCLERSRKDELRLLLNTLEEQKNNYFNNNSNATDKLFNLWSADLELKSEFKALLPYQRREYSFKKNIN